MCFSPRQKRTKRNVYERHYKERSCWSKFEFQMFFLSPSCLSSPRFIGIFHLCWTMLSTGPCSLILCDFFFFFAPMRYYISYLLDPFFFLFMELVDDVRECGGGQTLYAGDFIGPSPLLVLRRMCCVWWNILGQRCWIAMTTRALGLSPILFSVRESKVGEKSPRLYRYAPRRQAI